MSGKFDANDILEIVRAFFAAVLTVLQALGINFKKEEDGTGTDAG